jgi:hypothetical protein
MQETLKDPRQTEIENAIDWTQAPFGTIAYRAKKWHGEIHAHWVFRGNVNGFPIGKKGPGAPSFGLESMLNECVTGEPEEWSCVSVPNPAATGENEALYEEQIEALTAGH